MVFSLCTHNSKCLKKRHAGKQDKQCRQTALRRLTWGQFEVFCQHWVRCTDWNILYMDVSRGMYCIWWHDYIMTRLNLVKIQFWNIALCTFHQIQPNNDTGPWLIINCFTGIIFDHACGLSSYIYNREPRRFEYLRTLVDGSHWSGHKRLKKGSKGSPGHLGCSRGFNSLIYRPYLNKDFNSQGIYFFIHVLSFLFSMHL